LGPVAASGSRSAEVIQKWMWPAAKQNDRNGLLEHYVQMGRWTQVGQQAVWAIAKKKRLSQHFASNGTSEKKVPEMSWLQLLKMPPVIVH